MITNTALLKIAQKHLGQGGAIFRKYCGLPSGAAYCNAFVDYVANEGKVNALYFNGAKETYCPHSIKWCDKNLAQVPMYLAQPMDLIYMDWDRNGVPNHIGFVRQKKDTSTIYTIEGNTDGGKVAQKTRTAKYVCGIYRPHFKPPKALKKHRLTVDGDFSWNSVYMLQVVLGMTPTGILTKETVKYFQRLVNCTPDGAWGKKTSLGAQNMLKKAGYYHGKLDGDFYVASVKALQEYINAKAYQNKKPTPKPAPTPTPKKKIKSYRIDIDLTNQIATVYGIYSDKSAKALMSEFVSTARKGKTTPTGSFKIQGASGGRKAKLRTARMASGKSYAEYLCRFHGGKCMHCVPYSKRNTTGHVYKKEFNKLGRPASAGCVRMPYKMAKYIYTNCPVGTPVRVFRGKEGKFPMGEPQKYIATKDLDPTYRK